MPTREAVESGPTLAREPPMTRESGSHGGRRRSETRRDGRVGSLIREQELGKCRAVHWRCMRSSNQSSTRASSKSAKSARKRACSGSLCEFQIVEPGARRSWSSPTANWHAVLFHVNLRPGFCADHSSWSAISNFHSHLPTPSPPLAAHPPGFCSRRHRALVFGLRSFGTGS